MLDAFERVAENVHQGQVAIDDVVDESVREPRSAAREKARLLHEARAHGLSRQRIAVLRQHEVLGEDDVEHPELDVFRRALAPHTVDDDVEVLVELVHLGDAALRPDVLDDERVNAECLAERAIDVRSSVLEIDPHLFARGACRAHLVEARGALDRSVDENVCLHHAVFSLALPVYGSSMSARTVISLQTRRAEARAPTTASHPLPAPSVRTARGPRARRFHRSS